MAQAYSHRRGLLVLAAALTAAVSAYGALVGKPTPAESSKLKAPGEIAKTLPPHDVYGRDVDKDAQRPAHVAHTAPTAPEGHVVIEPG